MSRPMLLRVPLVVCHHWNLLASKRARRALGDQASPRNEEQNRAEYQGGEPETDVKSMCETQYADRGVAKGKPHVSERDRPEPAADPAGNGIETDGQPPPPAGHR